MVTVAVFYSAMVEHSPHYHKVKGSRTDTTTVGTERENGKTYGHRGNSGSAVVEYSPHYPKGLYYKTFCGRNLRNFVIS